MLTNGITEGSSSHTHTPDSVTMLSKMYFPYTVSSNAKTEDIDLVYISPLKC